MAGPRRAQYVSIPLGPGVLSNTTGRGARTRINYMNWDRWFDSTWVRWHKLLPEKQGGWQYQALASPNIAQVLQPGSPSLLLHFDGTDGATATVDSSLFANPMTFNGSTQITDTDPKFGAGCLEGPGGTSADYVSTPVSPDGPLDLSTGDFTVEFWCNPNSYEGGFGMPMVVCVINATSHGWYLALETGTSQGQLAAAVGGTAVPANSFPAVPLNQWTAIALVRKGNTTGTFQNGVAVGTATVAGNIGTDTLLQIRAGGHGGTFGAGFDGQIDELRITKGIALYTPGSNYTPATAPNTLGTPNALGSINPPNNFVPAPYLGIARDLHDWASIDGQFWIAIGTHQKLYVENQQTLYDITPQRRTSNVTNAITTINTSNVVTLVDTNHQAATGDFIFITGAGGVGGVTLAGNYQIAVVDPDTYTVFAETAATSSATGGGNFSIAYDIGAGLGANGQLLGYGTGPYGEGTYGTERPFGTGVFARMRTWSLDNFGQDLVASQSDGEIYYWARNDGPNSRATLLSNAPQGCQRVLVDAQQQVVIALGCTDVTSNFDAMLVRWCSFGDVNDWVPTDVNTAGDDILTAGSRIVTGLRTKGQNLIFTDTTLYRMVFVGAPDIYDMVPAGDVTIVGPNAAVDVDGVAYCMGFDNFYNYSGTLNLQSCDVWETVFDPNVSTSLNRAQSESVVAYTFEPKTEITWLYQSLAGAFSITFTGNLAFGATSATLSAPWAGATDFYTLQFPDQEVQPVLLTNGATTATWGTPLVNNVGGSAFNVGNDRYVTFNWEDGTWYYGAWNRTCAKGRAPAMGGFPYGVNAGVLYQHEVGTDAIEPAGTVALGFFMRSLDITVGGAKSEYTMGGSDARFAVGGSDAHLLVRSMIPDWKYMTGEMNLTLFTKDRPQDQNYVQSGPVAFDETTIQIDIDAHGSQIVIQFDNFTGANGAPSLGSSFRQGIIQGLATPYAKR